MNDAKCKALKTELAQQPEPHVISVERFFDGNDDLGSIGCNLLEHPGIDTFRGVLTGLQRRSDVHAVYAMIEELDPGDGCWPFTDTIFVVGTISLEELCDILSPLEPDEIEPCDSLHVPPIIKQKHEAPVLVVWWD